MPGLGHTVARLKRTRSAATQSAPHPSQMIETPDFGDNPGALRMLSYRPAHLKGRAPLVVVLHGCTQRAETFARQAGWLRLADRLGFGVVAPEQVPANNPQRCFNWFEAKDIRRGAGEAASIASMVEHEIRAGRADPARLYVTGLSAGGAMAGVMLATYPELFAAGAIVAGLPYGVASGIVGAMRVMRAGGRGGPAHLGALVRDAAPVGARVPRVAIWHGDADPTVHPRNAADLLHQWADVHDLPLEDLAQESLAGRVRSRLTARGSGVVQIESNLLHGLGHGLPLATLGDDGLGETSAFMLEAGISSSLEIAQFWGLADPAAAPSRKQRQSELTHPEVIANPVAEPPGVGAIGDQVMAAISSHVRPGVQEVIERALKTAGLRR